jgi:hypothetical protein
MNPTFSNLRSTRLENLGLEPYGFKFDLDGQTVQIRGDSRTPLVGAFQAFHRQALDEYRALEARPQPGLFSRLKSWIGRFFGGSRSSAEAEQTAPRSSPVSQVPTRSRAATEPAARSLEAEAGPEVVRQNPRRDPGEAQPFRSPAADRGPDPILRSVYADKDGVHLIWQPAAAKDSLREKASRKSVAMTCKLDSELGRRLQDCYGHLAELGYKVAGLELLKPEAGPTARSEKSPEKAVAAKTAAVASPEPEKERPVEAPLRPRAARPRAAAPKVAEPAKITFDASANAAVKEAKAPLPDPA